MKMNGTLEGVRASVVAFPLEAAVATMADRCRCVILMLFFAVCGMRSCAVMFGSMGLVERNVL